ncbi:MAG TPA: BON domain-containing protein [Rhodocyclaceae bacterium]|nr:BON domain-containing protein [Rhodocyclaceae bacterium]
MNHTLKALVIACASAACLQGCVPLVVAGAATGVSASIDRRSYGTQVEDSEIEVHIMSQINKQLDEKASISTTSLNKWVLLTGQTSDEASRQQAEKIASTTTNVRKVYNEVSVGWPSTVGNHATDALTTSQVKSRLFNPGVPGISGHNVKVVTEFGVVYMMGLVTEAEAKIAVDIARSTSGVKRVVNLFEVLNDEEMKRIDPKAVAPASAAPVK